MIDHAPTKMIQEANISGNRETRIPSPDLKRPGSRRGDRVAYFTRAYDCYAPSLNC
jgi:hypothetical protein